MKYLFSLIFALLLVSCKTQTVSENNSEIDSFSLNGEWKFNTFLGDGSNYLNVQPKKTDIVIDNSQTALVETQGKWKIKTYKGTDRETKPWGANYLSYDFKKDNDPAFVKFTTKVPQSGYYEHFIYYPVGTQMSALVEVTHADGSYTKDFILKTRPSVWVSLGIFKIDIQKGHAIKFHSNRQGKYDVDAIMLRPVDANEYLKSEKEKKALVKIDYDDSNWDNLKVPGHFGMINKYSNYSGKAWYRTEVKLPKTWKKASDERIRIQFEGVYHVARVFFNGEYVGRHQGGFTPFEFDITDKVNFSDKNILVVEADNNYLVGATWNWGGIIRDVHLVKNKDVRVKYQYIHAEPNLKTGTASYEIKVRVENNSAEKRVLKVAAVVKKGKPLNNTVANITVEPNSIKEFELKGQLSANDVKLWHFDSPELYNLKTSIAENGKVLDTKIDRFGIRKFEATATQMLLNGEPVRLVGFNRVSDHRYWGSSEPQELINLDVDLMKTAGANFTRIMHGTQNKKLLDRCDEKGILIFEEVNVRSLKMPEIYEDNFAKPKQWMKEMIERDANHASVVGWSVGNELSDHFDYVKMMYNYTKKLDPNRLALHVSNRGYRKGETPANNPLEYGDMIFQNIYQKTPGNVMDTLHKRWPNKAMFFSEFGVERFKDASLDNDITKLGAWYDNMRKQRPYTTGASIWTYNDYKSGYSSTLADENRAWGMVNAWRTKRRAFYTHQKENSPITGLNIENLNLNKQSATISFNVREADDFPSFTMRDYTLQYVFKNKEGEDLFIEKMNLPVLKPSYGKWSGNISWDKLSESPFELTVSLLATNGYSRGEKKIYFEVPSKAIIDEVKTANGKIRVHFTKKRDAFEYYLKYAINGAEKESYKTIANYIDLDSLPIKKDIKIQLIARNGKGDSKASDIVKVKAEGKILAPIIWDSFIADNKLIVGYSGTFEDVSYTIRYGVSKGNLNKNSTSNARGIMTINLENDKTIYFQIQREIKGEKSNWSNIVKVKK
ncbi:hypothetical protein MPF19_03980 [Polaribacter sp. Z014]|uniref:glycoside hydrolase family 2 TIM barrel-domain containing protein n=1 Tax=Polaribacter sp. Z014 TaxID=2927126 RepID=UPI002021721C|nr:glycoside hydrolase family 2 TIM barrel-domain containing protein [Polaribacter sp. Z014]MCL7762562.1 hypothetical protein [Polaribacter sp. Z014]